MNKLTISETKAIMNCYSKTPEGFQDFITSAEVGPEQAIILHDLFWS